MKRLIVPILLFCLAPALFAVSGQVAYTEGDVTLRTAGGTREVAIGDALGPGDVVITGPASLAILDLANGTTVKLREKTTLAINSLGEATSVTLSAGAAFTSIARKLTGSFTMRTSTAVAGVRGTEFFIAYGRSIDAEPDVWLCVNRGTVEVSIPDTGQSVLVNEGLGINIVGGSTITTPRSYPWTRRLNWNIDPASGKVEDATNLDQAYSDLLDQDYD